VVSSATSAALRAGRPDEGDFAQRQAMQRLLAKISGETAPPLLGRYRLIERLGEGSHGQVYEAWDIRLERRVALKVLTEPDDRGLQEARALAQVDAPGVVRIHELVEDPECTAVVMQFVQGNTIDAWAHTERHDWRTITERMAAVADALHRVHEAGIVHGDVKPSNIVVGNDGVAVLIDFSLAGRHEELAGPAGTPRFMAPEARTERPTARSDQYSFFATLRTLLAPPEPKTDGPSTTPTTTSTPAAGASTVGMPRALATIVARGTAHAPEDRFTSMRAAGRALLRLLGRRRRVVATVAIGSVLLGTWGWTAIRDARCEQVAQTRVELPSFSDLPAHADAAPVRARLDDALEAWSGAARQRCQAHPWGSLPSVTPPPCLESQRRRLATIADAMVDDPVRAVAHGGALMALLPDPRTCAEDPMLERAGWTAELDQQALLQTRDKLDRARVMQEFEPERAAALLAELESTALPACTWRPDLHLLQARQIRTAGRGEDAVEETISAAVGAEACGRDRLQAIARGQAVSYLVTAGRNEQATDWLRLLEATLERVPHLADETWRVHYARAELAYAELRIGDARRSYAAAERALEALGRPTAVVTHKRIAMMGLEVDPEAEAEAMRFIEQQTERWGATHPEVADAWGLHGTVLLYARRLDDAAPSLRKAAAMWSQWGDEFTMDVHSTELDLAVALQNSAPEESAQLLRTFIAFSEHELPDSSVTAEALTVLGRVERKLGEHTRALATTRRAIERLAASDGPKAATTLQARAQEGSLVGATGDPDTGLAIACEAARALNETPEHPPGIAASAVLSCLRIADQASERVVADLIDQAWLVAAIEDCEGMSVCDALGKRLADLSRDSVPGGGLDQAQRP